MVAGLGVPIFRVFMVLLYYDEIISRTVSSDLS